jgi:hypothetical protein
MVCHAQGIAKLQLQPRGIVQCRVDILFEGIHAAGNPQTLVLFGI